MKETLNYILEQIVKILMVIVIILILIGIFKVGKQFLNKLQSKIIVVQIYDENMPQKGSYVSVYEQN